jgi:hypothetical protein
VGLVPAGPVAPLDNGAARRAQSLVVGARWRQVRLVVLMLSSAILSCARGRTSSSEHVPQAEWSLTVNNRHSLDVTVYVISDGRRTHIGLVPSLNLQTYVLPPDMVDPGRTVRLEANAIGSTERVTTEALLVHGGQHVEWMIENGLRGSSVSIW